MHCDQFRLVGGLRMYLSFLIARIDKMIDKKVTCTYFNYFDLYEIG